MRRVAMVIVVSLLVVSGISSAQTSRSTSGGYVVREGDTLWWLEGYHSGNPAQWRQIVDANPFLKEPGRIYERGGETIALIRPGEVLRGLEAAGILPKPLSLSELQIAAGGNAMGREGDTPFYQNSWFWAFAIIVLTNIFLFSLWQTFAKWGRDVLERQRRKQARSVGDPATAGPPIVAGGIPPQQSGVVEARFEQIAQRRYGEINPTADLASARLRRMGPIEYGYLSGTGRVRYRDRVEERSMDRAPAYRAQFAFPNGQEEDLFFLQECANDVTFSGARYEGYTFEPANEVMSTPVQTTPTPGLEQVATTRTTVVVAGWAVTLPVGSVVRLVGDGIVINATQAGEITLGRHPTPKRTPRRASVEQK